MQKKNVFPLFTLSMMMYCISYSAVRNFATLFLQSQGFSNTEIGFFYSLGAAFSIISQLFLGTLLDKQEKITAKHLLSIVTGIVVLDAVMLYFAQAKWLIFWGFVFMNMVILLDKSLYNMFGLSYVNAGYKLNYSLARGIGSFSTSFFNIFIGVIISRYTSKFIFVMFFIMQTALFIVLHKLPIVRRSDIEKAEKSEEIKKAAQQQPESPAHPTIPLTDKNLWILFVSMLLIYSCYNAGNNYHINIIESLGGTSKELGISNAIMAMVELPAMAAFLPLSKKFSYRQILCFSEICFVLKVVCFALATNVYHVYAAQVLQLFSYGLFLPSSAYYINDILQEHRRGRGQALLGVFSSGLSGLLTSPIVGMLLDHLPVRSMLVIVSSVATAGIVGVIVSTSRIAAAVRLRGQAL